MLRRRNPKSTCHFCSRKLETVATIPETGSSEAIGIGTPGDFICSNCRCRNIRDVFGTLQTDPDALKPQPFINYAEFEPQSFGKGIFCHTCLKNQRLQVELLASHSDNLVSLGSEPCIPQEQERLARFREKTEKRYPLLCSKCKSVVEEMSEKIDYEIKTLLFEQALKEGAPIHQTKENAVFHQIKRRRLRRVRITLGVLWWGTLCVSVVSSLYIISRESVEPVAYTHPILFIAIASAMWTMPSLDFSTTLMDHYNSTRKGRLTTVCLRITSEIVAWISRIGLAYSYCHSISTAYIGVITFTLFILCGLFSFFPYPQHVESVIPVPLARSVTSSPLLERVYPTEEQPPAPEIDPSELVAELQISSKFNAKQMFGTAAFVPKVKNEDDAMEWEYTDSGKRNVRDYIWSKQRLFAPSKPTGLEDTLADKLVM